VRRIEIQAPAKVNPCLEVLARRPDGLHEVRTTLLALDRADRVTVELGDESRAGAPGISLILGGEHATPDVPADERNLAVRAARAVLALAGEPDRSLALGIEKRVPSRAGLGGGSADAAAAAFGTARLVGLDPDDPRLAAALGELGADVPFFLVARASGWALCTGRGERVAARPRLETSRALCVLTPAATAATGEVYAALRADELGSSSEVDLDAWWRAPLAEARASLQNDLERAALRSHPALESVRAALDAGGAAHFRLSGSGSSFFGLFASSGEADAFRSGPVVRGIARDHGLRACFVARASGCGVAAVAP